METVSGKMAPLGLLFPADVRTDLEGVRILERLGVLGGVNLAVADELVETYKKREDLKRGLLEKYTALGDSFEYVCGELDRVVPCDEKDVKILGAVRSACRRSAQEVNYTACFLEGKEFPYEGNLNKYELNYAFLTLIRDALEDYAEKRLSGQLF